MMQRGREVRGWAARLRLGGVGEGGRKSAISTCCKETNGEEDSNLGVHCLGQYSITPQNESLSINAEKSRGESNEHNPYPDRAEMKRKE